MTEVLLGQRIRDPLPIDHLALGQRNVDRVGDPVLKVVGLEVGGCEHDGVDVILTIAALFMIYLSNI